MIDDIVKGMVDAIEIADCDNRLSGRYQWVTQDHCAAALFISVVICARN